MAVRRTFHDSDYKPLRNHQLIDHAPSKVLYHILLLHGNFLSINPAGK